MVQKTENSINILQRDEVSKEINNGDIVITIPKKLWIEDYINILSLMNDIAPNHHFFTFLSEIPNSVKKINDMKDERFSYNNEMVYIIDNGGTILYQKLVRFDKYLLFIADDSCYLFLEENISFTGLFFNGVEKEDSSITLKKLQVHYNHSKYDHRLTYKLKEEEEKLFAILHRTDRIVYKHNKVIYPIVISNSDVDNGNWFFYITPSLTLDCYYYKNKVEFDGMVLYEDVTKTESESFSNESVMLPSPIEWKVFSTTFSNLLTKE